MDEETKSRVERLQAEIKLKTGTKVTQQELLAHFVESAVETRSALIDSFRDSSAALTDEELAQFNEGRIASGVETDEDDIDDILYDEVVWMDTDERIVVKKRTRTGGRGMLVPDDTADAKREEIAEELSQRARDRRDRNYDDA